ncbi:MAG: DUF3592 domain-containing protein [bacterium]
MAKKKTNLVAATIICIIIGTGFIALGIYLYFDYSGSNIMNPKQADGTIIRLHETKRDNRNPLRKDYHSVNPIVEFSSEEGKKYEFLELWGAQYDDEAFTVGQKVSVIYNELNPEEAMLKQENSIWGVHLFLIGMGLFFYLTPWLMKIAQT